MIVRSMAALGLVLAAPAAATAATVPPVLTGYVEGVLAGTLRDPAPTPGPLTTAGTTLDRLTPPTYADGFNAPTASARPSPRTVLNQLDDPANARTGVDPMTNLGVVMMQLFVSHEIARTPTLAGPENAFDLEVAPDDPIAVGREGRFVMPMQRSAAAGGTGPDDVRQQLNAETPAFDGSIVYGSTPERTASLRLFDGSGKMKTGPGAGLPIIDGRPTAGDPRADENRLLQSAHTLFLRQHNTIAAQVRDACDALGEDCSGDEIFEMSRRLVSAQTQKIVYDELLPAFLGSAEWDRLMPDRGLVGAVGGAINEATTAALRVGHSQVPNTILTIDAAGEHNEVDLASCFFTDCLAGATLDDIIRGAAAQPGAPVDTVFADALRNSQLPGFGATIVIDLPSTSTHRADDHGLGGYAALRAALGFADTPLDELLPPAVLDAYRGEDGELLPIPLFIGVIAEEPLPGAQVGPTAAALHALQFAALREHDPDFYDKPGVFDETTLAWITSTSLRDLILANTSIDPGELPADLFITPVPGALPLALSAVGALVWMRRRRAIGTGTPPAHR